MFIESFKVESPNVKYTGNEIHSVYNYETTELVHENRNGTYQWIVKPKSVKYEFKTDTHVPKLGSASKSPTFFMFFWGKKKIKKETFLMIDFISIFFWVSLKILNLIHFFFPIHHFLLVGLCLWDGEETTVQPSLLG